MSDTVTKHRTPYFDVYEGKWLIQVVFYNEEDNRVVDQYITVPTTEDKKYIFNEILSSKNAPNF